MSKKKLLTVAVVLLCALLALAGCQKEQAQAPEAQGDLLVVAQEKTTQLQAVSYLEDNSAVKMFLAELLIKTGATFPLSDTAPADGPVLCIGTAAQFAEKGIPSESMSYSKYSISVNEDGIYVCLGLESMVEDVLLQLKDSIIKQDDGSFCIRKDLSVSKDLCDISEVIPMFQTHTGNFRDLHDCGNGNYQASYENILEYEGPEAVAAYEQELLDCGYTLWQANDIQESHFATYFKGDTMIHINYFQPMNEVRIVYGPKTYLPASEPIETFEKKVTPSVSIIGMTENVLCMVVQLADGSFVVIDGGWDDDAPQTKTLNAGADNERVVNYFRDSTGDMKTLYEFMLQKAGGERPQVTWMITHADPDHILMPPRFFKEYAGLFDLNTIVYNFPNLYNIGLGESAGSTNDPMIMTSYAENFLYQAQQNYPNVNHFVYHTGQKLYLPGCEIEFLMTAGEDFWPNKMPWMNHTSGAWRFHMEGKSTLICGDLEKGLCSQLVGVFGNYLQSDILQVCHHGANGATLPFYRCVDPTVVFWPCQQYHLDYDNRQQGISTNYAFNKYLRLSEKVIGHYSNTETHTVLLPSLEEE